jgi:hypothetical protein
MDEDDDTQVYKDHGDALTIAYQSGYYDGKKAAQPAQAEQCNYPDCKCPTENPCLKGLAQPAQEPVVFCMHWQDRWGCNHYVDPKEPHPVNAKPLYTTLPQEKNNG